MLEQPLVDPLGKEPEFTTSAHPNGTQSPGLDLAIDELGPIPGVLRDLPDDQPAAHLARRAIAPQKTRVSHMLSGTCLSSLPHVWPPPDLSPVARTASAGFMLAAR